MTIFYRWSPIFPLTGMSFENVMKQLGHNCLLVSIFLPVVSAGHWSLLWNAALVIATWQQNHMLGLLGKHWIPLHSTREHTRHDLNIVFRVLMTNCFCDSFLLISLLAWIDDLLATFIWVQLVQWLHDGELIKHVQTQSFCSNNIAQSTSCTQWCETSYCRNLFKILLTEMGAVWCLLP